MLRPNVSDMTCSHCAKTVVSAVKCVDTDATVAVDLACSCQLGAAVTHDVRYIYRWDRQGRKGQPCAVTARRSPGLRFGRTEVIRIPFSEPAAREALSSTSARRPTFRMSSGSSAGTPKGNRTPVCAVRGRRPDR